MGLALLSVYACSCSIPQLPTRQTSSPGAQPIYPSSHPRPPLPLTLTTGRPRYLQFWAFSLLGMAFIEYNTITKAYAEPSAVTGEGGLKEDYSPGDLGFDPLNIKPKTEADFETMQTKELNNGRLAMIGIAGMLVQELINPANILG